MYFMFAFLCYKFKDDTLDPVEREVVLWNHRCSVVQWLMRTLNVEKPKRSSLFPLVAHKWVEFAPPLLHFYRLLLIDRDTKHICNAWKILFFSGDIIDQLCKKMQVIVMGVFMKSRFRFFNVIQVNRDPGWVSGGSAQNHRARGISVKRQHCSCLLWLRLKAACVQRRSQVHCWLEQTPRVSSLTVSPHVAPPITTTK